MKSYRNILPFVLAVLISACKTDTDVIDNGDDVNVPISFRSENTATRAGEPQVLKQDFLVYAYKSLPTSSTPVVVMDYFNVVHYEDNGVHSWIYEGEKDINGDTQPLRYWDSEATTYTFSAVTPKEDTTTGTTDHATISFDTDGGIKISDVIGNASCDNSSNSRKAPEWMVAQTVRNFAAMTDHDAIANSQLSTLNSQFEEVPLNFHHIMAKVEIRAYANSAMNLLGMKIELADGQEGIVNKGNYSVANGSGSWALDASTSNVLGEYTWVDGKPISDKQADPTLLAAFVEIPQTWVEAGRKFNVTITTKDEKVFTGDFTLNATTNGACSWDQNKLYTYALKIDNKEESQIILFAVSLDDWKWVYDGTVEDEQHNW